MGKVIQFQPRREPKTFLGYLKKLIIKYSADSGWDAEDLLVFIWDSGSLPSEIFDHSESLYKKYGKDIDSLSPKFELVFQSEDESDIISKKVYCASLANTFNEDHQCRMIYESYKR